MKSLNKIFFSLFLTLFLCHYVSSQIIAPLGSGTDGSIRSLYADSIANLLYVGGLFSHAGGVNANAIAVWNGSYWDSLGQGVDGQVFAITKFQNEIYAGGVFWKAGGKICSSIARWDGTEWFALPGGGTNSQFTVWDLYVANNQLYVTGEFDSIGGIPADKIARFDGLNWYNYPTIDTVSPSSTEISACIFYNNELYVCGGFQSPVNPDIINIAKWDGSNWQALGNGFPGGFAWPNSFMVYKNDLYVAGMFRIAWGDPGDGIAKWNGNNWSQPGNGLGIEQFAMGIYGNELYLADTNGTNIIGIYGWNGVQWNNIGIMADNGINAYETLNNNFYFAGAFHIVNGIAVNNIAQITSFANVEENQAIDNYVVFPDPADDILYFRWNNYFDDMTLEIINQLGKVLFQVVVSNIEVKHEINIKALSAGIYFLRFTSKNKSSVVKFMKQ